MRCPDLVSVGVGAGVILLVAEPWRLAALDKVLKRLPVAQRVHRAPEALVFVGHQEIIRDQTLEGLENEFLAFANVVEDLRSEDKIAAVDPDVGAIRRTELPDPPVLVGVNEMVCKRRPDGKEAGDLPADRETLDHVVEIDIAQPVAVVRNEPRLVAAAIAHSPKPLPH